MGCLTCREVTDEDKCSAQENKSECRVWIASLQPDNSPAWLESISWLSVLKQLLSSEGLSDQTCLKVQLCVEAFDAEYEHNNNQQHSISQSEEKLLLYGQTQRRTRTNVPDVQDSGGEKLVVQIKQFGPCSAQLCSRRTNWCLNWHLCGFLKRCHTLWSKADSLTGSRRRAASHRFLFSNAEQDFILYKKLCFYKHLWRAQNLITAAFTRNWRLQNKKKTFPASGNWR